MSQEFIGNKIKDLILDEDYAYDNYDHKIWIRTCEEEIIEPIEGVITGEIPKFINGSLLQNGPGAFKIGDVMLNHVFDGMAMLHRFNIINGKVTYQCRFVKSESYEKIKNENRMAFSEFGTPIKESFFQRILSYFRPKNDSTDNTLVSIYPLGNDFYAFTETPKIRKFNTTTLETLEKVDLKQYTGIFLQPGHPIVGDNGDLYNVGMNISSAGATYILFCIPNVENKFENVKIITKIPAKRRNYPSYMHSFGITENYFIVIEQPFTLSVYEMTKLLFTKADFLKTFKWFENDPVYIHLIDRKSGQTMHTYEAETFFFFHTINAYETDDQIVLDLICYKSPELVQGLLLENMNRLAEEKIETRMLNSRPLRYVLPLKYSAEDKSDKNLVTLKGSEAKAYVKSDGSVICFPELLLNAAFEFGTLNFKENYGKKYRYFYGIGMGIFDEVPGKLWKVDTENKTTHVWSEANIYPSEALFVPSPDAKSEDDGVLLSAILWGGENDKNRIGLLVLDAKTFKELGRCEFKDLKSPIPKCLHGWYLDENK